LASLKIRYLQFWWFHLLSPSNCNFGVYGFHPCMVANLTIHQYISDYWGGESKFMPMGPQNLVSNINHLIIGYSILIHTSTQFGISTSTGGHPARPAASGARVAPPELYSPLPRPVAGHRDIWQYTCGRWPATLKNNHMLT
jgi:hypothetical protein